MNPPFPGHVTEICGRALPERAMPSGYAALIDAYHLDVEPPAILSAIRSRHRLVEYAQWRLLTPRHCPAATLEGHLTFALKYEGVDLAVLKALFEAVGSARLATLIRGRPTGRYMRRIWFLAEWLTGQTLDLPALQRGSYVDALDPERQYAGRAVNSKRHRVRNNLPGTPTFCPLVFRTPALENLLSLGLRDQLRRSLTSIPPRHVPYLWVAIAGSEARPRGAAHNTPSTRLQWRYGTEGRPSPCITAQEIAVLRQLDASEVAQRYPDLGAVLAGVAAFAGNAAGVIAPPVAAACLAFGLARATGEADPFDPIHRYLAQKFFAHAGYRVGDYMIPVSVVAHQLRFAEYARLLTPNGSGGLFDATPHAEFYLRCMKTAIEVVVPKARRLAAAKFAESTGAPE